MTVAGSMAQFDYAMINAAVTETTISSIRYRKMQIPSWYALHMLCQVR